MKDKPIFIFEISEHFSKNIIHHRDIISLIFLFKLMTTGIL